ncbi:uncharacterized protein MELLADRAFT_85332 [Melampsora larici-populina 98AG31]|uniref:Uncharacterized protein n=1 Tax=Melampsora larici-populina (strain 98AG31 / pathotype 3-4-7) TaxID=747676 RepID=F4SD00_MELLP|nr:uncharacterized protein MELLADRAFT_85332 [Melampsora larici-populina 98AG31]EGF97477.1 hypothetical protein MELLADRAFT_85332 [Melampsora larici-populina 98AG31]
MTVTPEKLIAKWDQVTKFDQNATYPTSTAESIEQIMANCGADSESSDPASESGTPQMEDYLDLEDSEVVAQAKRETIDPIELPHTKRECILYNLGVGATKKELKYVFEGSSNFQVIPSYGMLAFNEASKQMPCMYDLYFNLHDPLLDWLPDFSLMMLLHGEHYLVIKTPKIPTSSTLVHHAQIFEATDKGKAASVVLINHTYDKDSGTLFENQATLFIRGSGGFGGRKVGKDRGAATALNKPPNRAPDAISIEKTDLNQAELYRSSGDTNPSHTNPDFAAVGGFKSPILHGLCF